MHTLLVTPRSRRMFQAGGYSVIQCRQVSPVYPSKAGIAGPMRTHDRFMPAARLEAQKFDLTTSKNQDAKQVFHTLAPAAANVQHDSRRLVV